MTLDANHLDLVVTAEMIDQERRLRRVWRELMIQDLTDEDRMRLLQRLDHEEGVVVRSCFDTLRYKGNTFVNVADVVHWLVQMSETVMSDQKQEVYRGLAEYLHKVTK